MNQIVQGQICVVTGGAQGIGWAISQALAAQGGKVYLCTYSAASLAQAAHAHQQLPAHWQLEMTQCDVTNRQELEGWLQTIYNAEGHIDVLVNNAAYVKWADLTNMSVEEQLHTMRVAYDGMVYSVNKVLPWMRQNGRGHIVNIGSIAGHVFVGGSSAAYAAAKAAMNAYTQILQVELADSPVQATIVRMGTVAGTNFFKKFVTNDRMPPLTQFIPALTPPKVANAVLKAIQKKKKVVTLPGFLLLMIPIYELSPRFSRWLAQLGPANKYDYANVQW